ncbi:hypothetical protein [Vagococcus xieshaowenii]|uniref:Uncharacterized protein n=1 Tax=Vagococcus xieshaowenii TaxID=2562451 RepID=A0AAJ5EFL4_9ENTE|nr:hypothetical protein [Vagococcus xieshaowenii]QCA29155.1 hypothetical protein E4Z98_07445 [Vagococcus xieshaowenii]TFZ40868.1 hypothetical protein E4031_05650 [Vagococcus xieshaowenii]
MEDKLQHPIFKAIMTGVFVTISYLISNNFLITKHFLVLSDPKWHVTVSVSIYSGLLNALFLYLLSLRTTIRVDITDKKDESYNILVDETPRSVVVKVKVLGNKEGIKEKVTIKFPEWIDSMVKADPSIKQVGNSQSEYCITINEEEISFTFDIGIKPMYDTAGRKNDISSEITGNIFRYCKKKKNLVVQYKK